MINMAIYIIKISKTCIAYFNLYNGFILTLQIIKGSYLMTNKRDIYLKKNNWLPLVSVSMSHGSEVNILPQ